MNDEEIKGAFAAFDPQHPFYKAVAQLLDDAVNAEQDNVTMADLADGARHFNAGRLAHAKDFRGFFHDTMSQSVMEVARAIEKQDREAARRAAAAAG